VSRDKTGCPYRGLQPFDKEDADYFFGRLVDRERIVSNLRVAPLTVLYGASGVGKTSVIQAGVVPALESTPRTAVVVFRAWHKPDALADIKAAVVAAVPAALRSRATLDPALPLDDLLAAASALVRGDVLIVFDQFEEYFLYSLSDAATDAFEAQFAKAVNRDDVRAHFLLVMREDSLSKLDRFKGRIRNILGNTLRISHLTTEQAAEAIRGPLRVYNERVTPSDGEVSIEPEAIDAILAQVRTQNIDAGDAAGAGRIDGGRRDDRIETPFLQLVMTELWSAEIGRGSRVLRRETFESERHLGGAAAIITRYVDTALELPADEQEICARVFRFLVTADQTKIALAPTVLASWSELAAAPIAAVMDKLARGQNHVLRTVEPASGQQEPRYELFHDVLGPAILSWRKRYVQEQEVRHAAARAAAAAAEREREAARTRELDQAQTLARAEALRANTAAAAARRLKRSLIAVLGTVSIAAVLGAYSWYLSQKNREITQTVRLKTIGERNALDTSLRLQSELVSAQLKLDDVTKAPAPVPLPRAANAPLPIRHLIVVMLENRSFDHMLGWLKSADYAIEGLTGKETNPDPSGAPVPVRPLADFQGQLDPDPAHTFAAVTRQLFDVQPATGSPPMIGFVRSYFDVRADLRHAARIMYGFRPGKLPVLMTLAREFAVCDHWFASVPGPSLPNRAFAHYGSSFGHVGMEPYYGEMRFNSIFERLAAAGRTATLYYFDRQSPVMEISNLQQLDRRFTGDFSKFLADSQSGTLPDYSFLEPNFSDHDSERGAILASDQHPDHHVLEGERFIGAVYNAIRSNQPLWNESVLLITYSNHGGIYDHVPPPAIADRDGFVDAATRFNFSRLGVRVPAIVVSPYVAKGTIDHTVYEHASIPATARKLFAVGSNRTSLREQDANTFERLLTLASPRRDAPSFELGYDAAARR
jgi:phospholipase C